MSEGFTVRPATTDDRPAILSLCRSTLGWGDDPRFDRLYEWKHEANAFGASYCWVAEQAGEVIGVRLFMRWEFMLHGRPIRAVRAVDTATHPQHQGRGIFTALTLHGLQHVAADGVEFVFNTPNDKSLPGYVKMGWSQVGRLAAAVRFAGPTGAVAALRSRAPADLWPLETGAGVAYSEWAHQRSSVDRIAGDDGLRTNWTTDRLAWRYSLPELGYRTLDHRDTSLVFRLRRRRSAVELVACDAFGDVSPRAVDRAIRHAIDATGASYGLRLGDPAWGRAVVPLPGGGPVLAYRPCGATGGAVPSAWALTMGDIELF